LRRVGRPTRRLGRHHGAYYPLTLPLTIDSGVIAVAVAIGANHAHTLDRLLIQGLAAVLGSAIVAISILVTIATLSA
jgi:hypothetical protein